MILSTKGRYGLRAMFVLAQNYGKGPVSLTQIAELEAISVNYLEQLFLPLRKQKLIASVRGAHGGYLLNHAPDKITIGSVIKTLEGPLLASECVDVNTTDCDNLDYCVTRTVWSRITQSVDDVIESITLQNMLDDHAFLERERRTVKIDDILNDTREE